MATVRDLIYAALREINALSQGEAASSGDAQDALDALGRLQDRWATERLYLFARTRTTFTITQTTSFTLGTGGTINTPRPTFVDGVSVSDTTLDPDIETPLKKMDEADFRAYTAKALTSALPSDWYYNPTFPTGTLYLLPIPTQSGLEGVVYAGTPVTKFTSLDTTVSLPPGYEELIVTNLAVRCAPMFRAPVHPELKSAAKDAIAHVKRLNRRTSHLKFDENLLSPHSVFDIRTDW